MIDHVGFYAKDMNASLGFYDAALAPIGYKRLADFNYDGFQIVGYGDAKPDFWVSESKSASSGIHLCFSTDSRQKVEEFYKEAMAHGGTDNGGPGIRKEYAENYYAAFVRDPDGNNIEVVTFAS